jgi:NAD(P)H-hydrate epimerase
MHDPMNNLVYSRDAVRRVDAEAVSTFGIPSIVLMENAACGVANCAHRMVATIGRPARILVVCGTGNNGGDGWAAARHLTILGHECTIAATGEPQPGSDARTNADIAQRMKLPFAIGEPPAITDVDLVIDALLGTGLARDVTGPAAAWIDAINNAPMPVLAVDLPSGMDADTGLPRGTAVRADCTVTFVGRKLGFLESTAPSRLGRVEIVDIGVPTILKQRHGRPLQG